ncbi:hypothetical protein ABT275_35150 [Streptomyces sp. NPDC001185]|uniref:hypothetical protein n=1 Tax=Streptomyces sp. NPDC001185 TaxID=3154380 RepID=UPI0033291308
MKFFYDDESFSFEALRAAGYAAYGGADLSGLQFLPDTHTAQPPRPLDGGACGHPR